MSGNVLNEETRKELAAMVTEATKSAVAEATKGLVESIKEKATDNAGGVSKTNPEPRREFQIGSDLAHEKGIDFARCVRLLTASAINHRNPLELAKEWAAKDGNYARVLKSMTASDFGDGGAFIPSDLSAEFVGLLYNATAVRGMGARSVPVPNGVLNIGKLNTGATASYTGEATAVNASQGTTGQLSFSAKKLVTVLPVSNDLARRAAAALDAMLKDDLVQAAAVREDLAFISGDGSSSTPKGILNWTASGNKTNSAGTTLANVVTDLTWARRKLKDAKIPMVRPGWLMSPRSEEYLLGLRDSAGGFIFRDDMMNRGILFGFPYKATQQIPDNLGGGTNESKVYLVDFAQCLIGDTLAASVEVGPGAAYVDSTGTLVSGFSRDETVLRLISEHDFIMRYDTAAAIVQAVTWGA